MNPGLPDERVFTLPLGTVTIGRTQENAIFCLHKSLSRRHAQLDFDGVRLGITDLESKNGVFVNGRRVVQCELVEGDSFRCGDITFLLEGTPPLEEGTTMRTPRLLQLAHEVQTLPSPFAAPVIDRRGPKHSPPGAIRLEDQSRYKDKLFLLIRVSELLVSEMKIDGILEELVALAIAVLETERVALLALDDTSLEMRARVVRASGSAGHTRYSKRVVDWVVDHGSPACFADVSCDRTLPGDISADADIRGAICAPINPGGGTIGVIYADSLSRSDCFRPEDLALLRALANLAAVALESAALRRSDRQP